MNTVRNFKYKKCDVICSKCGIITIISEKEFSRYKLFESIKMHCHKCNDYTIHYILKDKDEAKEKIKTLKYTNRRIQKLTKLLNIEEEKKM